jgi:transcriptional regulator with XRE-family HTH domain
MAPVLGATLGEARRRRGWSIEQLSKRSGVPGQLIRRMEEESVTYVPSEANTVHLAEALRMPAGPLLEEREQLFKHLARRDLVV